jgi:membrane associated rhomboid family serine protease
MATIIIIVTVLISLAGIYGKLNMDKFILTPAEVYHNKKYYQVITSGFLHSDFMHLLFNMFSFYFFAYELESMVGAVIFALIYFGSMIIADIPSIMKEKYNPYYRTLGASGAVSGIVFASVLINPGAKMMILPLPIPLPGYVFAILYIIYCQVAERRGGDNINHSAHLWGGIGGLVLTVLLFPESIGIFIEYFIG